MASNNPINTTHSRDAALRQLGRFNRWLLAGSVALTAVLTDVAANAFPGKKTTTHRAGAKAGAGAHTSTGESTATTPLAPPAQSPSSAESARVTPESSQAAPESSQAAPESSQAAPESSQAAPESSQAAPESSQAAPESSQAAPETSQAAPDPHRGKARTLSSPEGPEVREHERAGAALPTARWQALGTTIVMQALDRSALDDARAAVERELDAIDLACSRFRADSELARLNAASGRSRSSRRC